MAKAYRMDAMVLQGRRIAITAPEVEVGQTVEVIVSEAATMHRPRWSMLAFLDSWPRIEHTEEERAEIDRQFQEERDARER